MAPKRKQPTQLGSVRGHGEGWRVEVKLFGKTQKGPVRSSQSAASNDLARAQRCKTQEEMRDFVRDILGSAQPLAGVRERLTPLERQRARQATEKYKVKKKF